MDNYNDLQQLAALLNPKKNPDDSSDEEADEQTEEVNQPNQISEKPRKVRPYDKIAEPTHEEVVDPEETQFASVEDVAISDWRKCPQWDITYRQQVTPSDVYLQMSGKTPATASCEDMILTVEMPGEKFKNIDIKITRENLNLLSPQYKLIIPLPHRVDAQRGNAKWDSDKEKLVITLRMDREYDYVNF